MPKSCNSNLSMKNKMKNYQCVNSYSVSITAIIYLLSTTIKLYFFANYLAKSMTCFILLPKIVGNMNSYIKDANLYINEGLKKFILLVFVYEYVYHPLDDNSQFKVHISIWNTRNILPSIFRVTVIYVQNWGTEEFTTQAK